MTSVAYISFGKTNIEQLSPTELKLLFEMAGIEVLHLWGGTAGQWGRRQIELDEIEIMVLGRKAP